MHNAQKISGNKAVTLLEQTQQDRIVVTMYLLGKNYERLTIITQIYTKDGITQLAIDKPGDFDKLVKNLEERKLRFEFTGKDKLHYLFRTLGGEVGGNEIFVPFPEFIERIQRRQQYRLEPPVGTRMHFVRSLDRHEMTILNVSEGGALICHVKGNPRKSTLQADNHLRGLSIVFPSDEETLKVNVLEAVVKRVTKDPHTNHYRYALQFVQLSKTERKTIAALIQRFEREFLRKRQLLDH